MILGLILAYCSACARGYVSRAEHGPLAAARSIRERERSTGIGWLRALVGVLHVSVSTMSVT